MLTNKPLLTVTLPARDGYPEAVFRYQPYGTKKKPLSQRTFRERYRKASIRLRKVGSKEQTSIKLQDIYSPHFSGTPDLHLEMKRYPGDFRD